MCGLCRNYAETPNRHQAGRDGVVFFGFSFGGLRWYAVAMDYVFVLASGWAVSAVIGYFIGATRGRGGAGAVWGALLGPIGWLVMLVVKDERKKCPFCGGVLGQGAVSRCKNCGECLMRRVPIQTAIDPVAAWAEAEEIRERPLPPPPQGWQRGGGSEE